MNEISEIRTNTLWTEGQGMDRTMDEVLDEWEEWFIRVHQGLGECDEVQRYADIQKLRKEVGLWGKWKGKEGNGWDDFRNNGDT